MIVSPRPEEDVPTAAGMVSGLPETSRTAELIPRASALRYRSGQTHKEAVSLDRAVFALSLAERQTQKVQKSPQSLLIELNEQWGLAWSSIAQLVGVTVPAVRKWRKGEQTSGANRAGLAKAAALLQMLDEQFMIEDPAAWLEVPLASSQVTALDIAASGAIDMVIEYAGRRINTAEALLSAYDPEWDRNPREFETFLASDGELAIRRRRG